MARSIVPSETINRAAYLPDWSQFATKQDLAEMNVLWD